MRIAFITGLPAWGGSEELWAAAAEAALREGYQVGLWLHRGFEGPRVTALQARGASVRRRRWVAPGRVARIIAPLLRSFADLSAFRPDVVCISQPNTYSIVEQADLARALRYVRSAGIPYVLVCQWNSGAVRLTDYQRDEARSTFAAAHRVAFVAMRNCAAARRQLVDPLPNAIVVQNPVNLSDRSAVPWPDGAADAPARLACVARLVVDYKGQDVLLEALAGEVWRQRNWRLDLYGSGPDEQYLIRLAAYYGLAERVACRGHVADVRKIWAENHLLVLPSRSEGTPLALVEAMVCGRPVVVTDVGGNAAQVADGETGFVAAAPTVGTVAAALERAWAARERWQRMGELARETTVAHIDPEPGRTLLAMLIQAAVSKKETHSTIANDGALGAPEAV